MAAIAGFALVLGFVHEEEFLILALAFGGVNPALLMLAYATSVSVSLIGITVVAVKLYAYRAQDNQVRRVSSKIERSDTGHNGGRLCTWYLLEQKAFPFDRIRCWQRQ